jgi:hypothetical protein
MTLDEFRQSLTATDPPAGLTFGRNPCRSSSLRRSLYRVFLAAQFLDMHGHGAAPRKMRVKIGNNLSRRFFRRRVPRMASPQNLHGEHDALLFDSSALTDLFFAGSVTVVSRVAKFSLSNSQ